MRKINRLLVFGMFSKCRGLGMPVLSVYFPISNMFQGDNIFMKCFAKYRNEINNLKSFIMNMIKR